MSNTKLTAISVQATDAQNILKFFTEGSNEHNLPEWSLKTPTGIDVKISVMPDNDPLDPIEDDEVVGLYCEHRSYDLGNRKAVDVKDEIEKAINDAQHVNHEDQYIPCDLCDGDGCEHCDNDGEVENPDYFDIYNSSVSDLMDYCERHDIEPFAAVTNLYLYDHSGLSMNTTGFSCGWDSGQVGIGFITWDQAKANYGLTATENFSVRGDVAYATHKGAIPEGFEGNVHIISDFITSTVKAYDCYLRGDAYGYVVKVDDEPQESCWGYIGGDGDKTAPEYCLSEGLHDLKNVLYDIMVSDEMIQDGMAKQAERKRVSELLKHGLCPSCDGAGKLIPNERTFEFVENSHDETVSVRVSMKCANCDTHHEVSFTPEEK